MLYGGGIGPLWSSMYNYQVASQASRTAQRGVNQARQLQTELRRLEDKLDELTLVCMGMWSLLTERTDLTEQDLADRVQELDLQDGTPDGKVTHSTRQCPQCGRTMSARHARCLYCGAEDAGSTPFGT